MQTNLYPWQEKNWQQFEQRFQQQKQPHALLFAGQVGLGKYHFACHAAQYLLCAQHQACGQCKACHLFSANTHADFLCIEPEGKSQTIKVDQIRELTDFIASRPQQGDYRVIIIHHAERMNTAASNALLKSLEEPGEHCVFFLTSAQPMQLLATVRSRLQMMLFHASLEQSQHWLEQQSLKTDLSLAELWALNPGSPLQIPAMIDSGNLSQQLAFISQLLTGTHPIALAERYKDQPATTVLHWLVNALTDVLKAQSGIDHLRYLSYAPQLQQYAQTIDPIKAFNLLDHCHKIQASLQQAVALNTQLLLEETLIYWHRLRLKTESMAHQ